VTPAWGRMCALAPATARAAERGGPCGRRVFIAEISVYLEARLAGRGSASSA
jgi:hypothetical protein